MARKKIKNKNLKRFSQPAPSLSQGGHLEVTPEVKRLSDWLPESPLEKLSREFEQALKTPSVSVVIANRNGAELLRHCLFALATQTYPVDEIILVDNGSTDDSLVFVLTNYPRVKILESEKDFGYAMGVNLGARCAVSDLVVVLGNDMIPTPDWLSHLVEEFQKRWPEVGVVASKKLSGEKSDSDDRVYRRINFLGYSVQCHVGSEKVSFAPENSAFIYARYLNLEGPFDPDFQMEEEEVYFGWRSRLLGYQVSVAPAAKIFQKENSIRFTRWKRAYYKTRNRWVNLLIFYDGGNLIRVFPWIFLEGMIRLFWAMATSLSDGLGVGLALFWIFLHPVKIYSKRKLMQRRRKVLDCEIIRDLSGKIVDERSKMAGLLNGISLFYCRWIGLRVEEKRTD